MSMKKVLYKAIHDGMLKIGDKELPCAVLDNGMRVLSASSIFSAFDRPRKGKNNEIYRVDQMPSFLDANNLQPFVNTELMEWTNLISYIDTKGVERTGYNGHILRGLCKVYIDANNAGTLTKRQLRFVPIAETLLYALADVGIVALIDEATGYQHDREKDELQKILNAYIAPELLPWQKRFPDTFYKHLFRLNKWEYSVRGIQKRPGVIGKWTNTIIYNELPKGVMEELKKRTPISASGNKTARYHQYLTVDIGEPHLEKQIVKVITLFEISDNMREFWSRFAKMKERQTGQLSLPFEFDEEGHTKEE
ncbi:MAG: P63C domain-containing protein [Prevotella sp.]|nr:P63C domain-containing protein [Candidatus Prevotella equi]